VIFKTGSQEARNQRERDNAKRPIEVTNCRNVLFTPKVVK
jgi:hypothetical protein